MRIHFQFEFQLPRTGVKSHTVFNQLHFVDVEVNHILSAEKAKQSISHGRVVTSERSKKFTLN